MAGFGIECCRRREQPQRRLAAQKTPRLGLLEGANRIVINDAEEPPQGKPRRRPS